MQQIEEEAGSIMVLAVLVLAVLTILGVSAVKLSSIDLRISRNEAVLGKHFYVAEGGLNREAQELGNGSYRVRDVFHPTVLADRSSTGLPPPAPHLVGGEPYEFTVAYSGFSIPPKGYSARAFSQFNYPIHVRKNSVRLEALYYTIGPRYE